MESRMPATTFGGWARKGLYDLLATATSAPIAAATFNSVVTTDPALIQYHPQ